MADGTKTISRGLAAYDGPTGRALSSFNNGIKSLSALVATAEQIDSRAEAFAKRVGMLWKDMENSEATERQRYAELAELSQSDRNKLADKAVVRKRQEISKRTEKERYDVLKLLQAESAKIDALAELYESPATLLMREGLGTEERSRYLDQLAHSGPVELERLAALAVNTNDRILAAAINSKLDAMSPEARKSLNVSRNELAREVVGADYDKARGALSVARNRLNEAIRANRNLEHGKRLDGFGKLSETLARKGEPEPEESEAE